jgi:hypothetical protein
MLTVSSTTLPSTEDRLLGSSNSSICPLRFNEL